MEKLVSRVIPVRDMEREKASSGHGKVKTWKMSPEELEDYRARTGYKKPNQPIHQGSTRKIKSSDEQSREASMRKTNEPDKQSFLSIIAAGESIAAAERKLGLKPNGLYYWLKKWDLIGINPDKAKELLGHKSIDTNLLRSTSPDAMKIEEKATARSKK